MRQSRCDDNGGRGQVIAAAPWPQPRAPELAGLGQPGGKSTEYAANRRPGWLECEKPIYFLPILDYHIF